MLGFTGSPLDRAEPLRRDAHALRTAKADPSARWLILDDLKPVMAGPPEAPTIAWATAAHVPDPDQSVLLGLHEGAPRFAAAASVGDLGTPADARVAALAAPAGDAAIIAQGRSLIDWHARHPFCAACGQPTAAIRGGYARACSGCGAEHFPRVNPVAIMLVTHGDYALLGRQGRFPPGFLSALAGYAEPGESIEETVARETHEEAGVRVGAMRYIASQPWPFPSNLMLGFIAEALTTEVTIDPHELEEARWVPRADIEAALAGTGPFRLPPPLAIAHHLIATWLSELPSSAS